mmetsp:Transcript_4793/g.19541  ORF Transcript_4793/g.19541 Transcript_4793/m.19541 type:complete len:254 (-) Transcript_4793:1187-1948(-)
MPAWRSCSRSFSATDASSAPPAEGGAASAEAAPLPCPPLPASGFIAGKSRTSRIEALSVRNMVSRSMPQPQPPVGARPCSNATQKSSSLTIASSSPAAVSAACAAKRSRWTKGLLSSVYALQSSFVATNSSKRSVTAGLERWYLARGDMTAGCSVMKAGDTHLVSSNSPTRLSTSRATVCGGLHGSIPAVAWTSSNRGTASAASSSAGDSNGHHGADSPSLDDEEEASWSSLSASRRPSNMGMRGHGGAKSMS